MDMQKQAMKYWQLLQQGYSPADAYAQAFPNGIPTEQERLEDAAKQEQKAGLAQAGGVLAGALGAREIARAVAGEETAIGGLINAGKEALTERSVNLALDDYFAREASEYAAQEIGSQALSAPEVVGAERVLEGGATHAPAQTGIGSALPYAGAALGAYGLYDIGRRWGAGDRSIKGMGMGAAQGAASGAAVGNVLPGPGTLIGAIVGGLYGLASSAVKAGKHKDQIKRDAVRSMLQDNGFLDDEYGLTLATGQRADLGLDGSATYKGVGGEDIRYGFETDWKNPLTGESVGRLNALAAALTGGDQKATSDLVSQLNNAVLQGSPDANAAMLNVRGIYDKTGLTKDDLFGRINALEIDDPTKAAYHNAINSVFENRAYGAPGTSDPLAFMQQQATQPSTPTFTPSPQVADGLGRTGTLSPTLADQLGIKGPAANLPSQHQGGSLQDLAAQWGNVMPDSWAGDRRGNIPLPGMVLPQRMSPEEMAIQRQFGSQLAAALAGR